MNWPWTKRAEERAAYLPGKQLGVVEPLNGDRHFGQVVNAITVEWLSSATAAIDAISATVGSLPALVYRKTATGRQEDGSHALARLIQRGPNEHQTWVDFSGWLIAETLRNGNGVAEIVRDDAGTEIVGLRPLPADRLSIKILPGTRLAYDFTDHDGNRRRLLAQEVIHVRVPMTACLAWRAIHAPAR